MAGKRNEVSDEVFYRLEVKALWRYFKSETLAFWMITLYLFTEYVRPQSIIPWLDFLPWAQVFLLGAMFGLFVEPNKKWVASPINKWLIIFFAVILISSYTAFIPELSYKNLYKYYLWVIIYFLIINIVTTEKRLIIFLSVFLLASYKLSLSLSFSWASRGFSFTSWGLRGPPGFFTNSGELAIQMLVYWPIAFAFVVYFKDRVARWKRWVLISMPVTAGMVILGTSSRGGQLALLIQLVARYSRQIFRPKILVTTTVILLAGWHLLPQEQKERFSTSGEDRTSQQRLLYWENGIDMANKYPFSGVGYFNFIPYYETYYRSDMLYGASELAHNIFVQVGADLGYVGLTIYLYLIFLSFRCAVKAKRNSMTSKGIIFYIAPATNLSLLGFVVAGQFVSVVYYPYFWINLAIVSCLYNISLKNTKLTGG